MGSVDSGEIFQYNRAVLKQIFGYAGGLTIKYNLDVTTVLCELILAESDLKRQAEAVFYTLAFGERHFPERVLRSLFKEDQAMYEHWERVPIFGERIRERFRQGKQEGREEGREEGQILAFQESILDFLATRFATENGRLARLVNAIDDPKKLRAIYRRILKVKSIDTVVDILQKTRPATKLTARGRKTSKSTN